VSDLNIVSGIVVRCVKDYIPPEVDKMLDLYKSHNSPKIFVYAIKGDIHTHGARGAWLLGRDAKSAGQPYC
jgi:hypothetical protein